MQDNTQEKKPERRPQCLMKIYDPRTETDRQCMRRRSHLSQRYCWQHFQGKTVGEFLRAGGNYRWPR